MSEQPAGPAPAARKPPPGKKIGPLTQNQAIGVGIAGVIILGVLLLRRRKNAAQQAQAATPGSSAGAGVGTCPDGSSVDCGGLCPDGSTPAGCDQSGQLSTLATELGQLESALAQGQGGGGSGGVSTVPVTGTDPGTSSGTSTSSGTGTAPSSGGSSSGGGTTNPAPLPPGPAAGRVTGLKATVGKTTAKVTWAPAAGATGGYSYVVRDLSVHRNVNEGVTHDTTVSLSSLKSKTTFNFGIQALPGGPGTNIHFTTT